jgi:predicted dienelactone hydrolase
MKRFLLLLPGLLAWFVVASPAPAYDPLDLSGPGAAAPIDFTVHDAKRERDIPVRVFLPSTAKESAATTASRPAPVPVVLFSHGLGGNREGSPYLGEHWAARGYAVVYVQHPGSDDGVWKTVEPADRMAAMKRAASAQNLILRIDDIPTVLDQLAVWNKETGHALAGRLDLGHIGMSGHSFGAQTTQAVSGQTFPGDIGQRPTDARIRAATAFSPNIPKGGDPQAAFGGVRIPWMLMTGTKDGSPIGGATPESRQAVFPALPPGDKYELVLDKAEHSVFTDRPLPGETEPRNPNHHRVILALTTAFWDAYLKENAEAKAWLEGEGPRRVMEASDRWQRK